MTEIAKAMLDRMRELTEHPEAKVLRATYDAWERGDVPETTLLTREVFVLFQILEQQNERITQLERGRRRRNDYH
jgi:ketosteroid isomerase-like protein